MLTYDMDSRGERPLYEHLYRCIRQDIERGTIATDERLPSKRKLAQHLGVSVVTVEGAYRQLVAEGYARAIEKRGYYVNPVQLTQRTNPPAMHARTRADALEAEADPFRVEFASLDCFDHEVPALVDLASGVPAEGTFPLNVWASCVRGTLAEATERALHDESYAQGSLRLRQAIATHLQRFRGIQAAPEQIVVGAGAQVLYQLIVQFLGDEASYALEDPGYRKLAQIYAANGARVHAVALDEQGIDVRALERSGARIAHVMPSHQFPTGRVMSVGRRYELLGWAAAEADRCIIEDDYDSEFRLSGKPIPALASIDVAANVIYLNTFAKTLGPALRVGYMVLPANLVEPYMRKLGFYACTVSAIDQFALARFMETGDYERHINRARAHYRKLRDSFIDALKESALGERLTFSEIDSGIHFGLGIETQRSTAEVRTRLQEQGVRISAMSDHALQHHASETFEHPGTVQLLMNYAGLEFAQIPQVVAAFEVSAG